MLKSALSILALAACATGPQDPKEQAEKAIESTRGLKSYRTKFKARIAAPQGDPIDYNGTSVWVAPGVLWIHYTASGGDLKNIVRAGPHVWVYHEAAGWVTSDEIGSPGLGRGIQNPDEILGVLLKNLVGAKLTAPGVVELSFTGDDIEKVMKEQAQQGAFDWKQSKATAQLHVGTQGIRLQKFACQAELKSTNPAVKGIVKYSADVAFESYNQDTEMQFLDEKKRPIPLDPDIKKAIEAALKEKK